MEPEQASDFQNILSMEIHKGSRIQPAAQLAAHGKERRGRGDDKQEGAQKNDKGKTWEHVLNWLGYMKSGEKTRGNSLETPNVWVLSSFHPQCFETAASTPMFGFCPLFTPTLLSRRAGSDVDATAAADRTQKPRRFHVSTGQNKKGATRERER